MKTKPPKLQPGFLLGTAMPHGRSQSIILVMHTNKNGLFGSGIIIRASHGYGTTFNKMFSKVSIVWPGEWEFKGKVRKFRIFINFIELFAARELHP